MADAVQFYYLQLVTADELNQPFTGLENADRHIVSDMQLTGVASGLAVTQQLVANMTVQVSQGVAYDKIGERVAVPATQTVDLSVDSLGASTSVPGVGNSRIVSVFIAFDRNNYDPRTDGNSQ